MESDEDEPDRGSLRSNRQLRYSECNTELLNNPPKAAKRSTQILILEIVERGRPLSFFMKVGKDRFLIWLVSEIWRYRFSKIDDL